MKRTGTGSITMWINRKPALFYTDAVNSPVGPAAAPVSSPTCQYLML